MKKNFFKKLAFVLAAAVAVTSVNVPTAEAKTAAPAFKSQKVKVKVGQTKKYGTKNSSKYSVKFAIGNTYVAKIKHKKGSKFVEVTGVAESKTH